MKGKFWVLWLLVTVLAACAGSGADVVDATRPATAEASPAVGSTGVPVEIVTPRPGPTLAECTPLPEGLTIQIRATSDTAFILELEGLQAGERLTFLLTGLAEEQTARIEWQPTTPVGPDGRFHEPFDLAAYVSISQRQGQVRHMGGVACFEWSLPLSPDQEGVR